MSSSAPLTQSDLIFPEASKSLQTTLTSLKRTNLSITNRLRSIDQDAIFVRQVANEYQLPLVANERCGGWYIHPDEKKESVYFKSTDGHFGQWGFNLRRLNFHLFDTIARHNGCIIVDSTRRGKSMPDALSKTVPTWITVLNRWLFPDRPDVHELVTPEKVVSKSEHSQIESRLPLCLDSLRSLGLDPVALRTRLNDRPLTPHWVSPDSGLSDADTRSGTAHLVVLCTASGRTSTSALHPIEYVQGAADDSESWAWGLDASTFWGNRILLLSTPEDDLPDVIKDLTNDASRAAKHDVPTQINSTPISIGSNASAESAFVHYDIVISCSSQPSTTLEEKLQSRYIHLPCTAGKVGSRQIRDQLPRLKRLGSIASPCSKILVTCVSGRDHSVGVTLAIMCLANGAADQNSDSAAGLSKVFIKQTLSRITLSMPDAAPSRATLQSVNAFLLGQNAGQIP